MNATPDQFILQVLSAALPLLLLATIAIVVILGRRRMNRSPIAPPEIAADGVLTVPVRALYLRRAGILGGVSRNSINPRFAITPDGIRFKVFRETRLPFSAIDHVEVREWFGRLLLLFVNAANPRLLSVDVGNRATAKCVLDALPRSIALTPEAATIRDGVPAAGTSGPNLFRGRFW
ncbi:hypothetical protein PX554_19465 [Sphingomonas sp. H39-1-10]|uniref:hypothetical protein n=1 Tax=Sphingomonas pollutisoli TaxID=3030829 RepID=UPI0023B8C170|nr:hypothetical protein [Sphingomonas pollutisoli]MDF0490309.1 hypothetical protein [Sphingomonas pollutisoli]